MSKPRAFQMGGNNAGQQVGDTTHTKIFVGGIAWETNRETMGRYFEQFGEIQEAVVITDKNSGRSKGYGFVTFKDPDAAARACQDPSPVIDGRRANCNLAYLGAHRTHPPTPDHGMGRVRPLPGSYIPSYPATSSTYFHQPVQLPWYSQENMYPMNYYNVYGGSQFSPYYAGANAGSFQNFYPYYTHYPAGQQAQGSSFAMQYLMRYPYMPQQPTAAGILSVPPVAPSTTPGVTAVMTGTGPSHPPGEGPTSTTTTATTSITTTGQPDSAP